MPKSKNRKKHKKRIKARNETRFQFRRRYINTMRRASEAQKKAMENQKKLQAEQTIAAEPIKDGPVDRTTDQTEEE